MFLWDSGSSVGEITGHNKVINSVDIKQTRPYRLATGSDDNCAAFFEGPPFKFKFTLSVSLSLDVALLNYAAVLVTTSCYNASSLFSLLRHSWCQVAFLKSYITKCSSLAKKTEINDWLEREPEALFPIFFFLCHLLSYGRGEVGCFIGPIDAFRALFLSADM